VVHTLTNFIKVIGRKKLSFSQPFNEKMEKKMKKLIFALLIFYSNKVLTCQTMFPGLNEHIRVSYSNDLILDLNKKAGEKAIRYVDCRRTSGKYLLIRNGIQFLDDENTIKRTFFGEKIPKFSCSLKNFEGSKLEIEKVNYTKNLESMVNTMSSCIRFKVSDLNGKPLHFDPTQKNCTIESLSDSEVLISKGDCFFKIDPTNSFEIKSEVKKECLDREFLVKNKVKPGLLDVVVNTYIYDTPSVEGTFNPRRDLSHKNVVVEIESGKELLPSLEELTSYQEPILLPSIYHFPEIIISDVEISKFGRNNSLIKLVLAVDSAGKKEKCNNGLCSSENNYFLPLAGELLIYEISAGRKKNIYSGFIGDKIRGQWQGMIKTAKLLKDVIFEEDKSYLFNVRFSDPNYDFKALKKGFSSMFESGIEYGFSNSLIAGRDTLSSINELSDLREVENLGALNGDILKDFPESFRNIFLNFKGILLDDTFPPAYNKVCNKAETKCRRADKNDHLILTASFNIDKFEGSYAKISKLKISKNSKLSKGYNNLNIENKPQFKCEMK